MAEIDAMDAQEFSYWLAYASLEPIGDKRDDLRIAAATSWIVNATSSGAPKDVRTYMLDFRPGAKKRRQRALEAKARGIKPEE